MSAYTSVPPAGPGDGEIPIFPGPRPARLCASRFLRRPSHDSSAVSTKPTSLISFPFLASCFRLPHVLLHPQLRDPFDEVVRNQFVQWKLKIALRAGVSCDSF